MNITEVQARENSLTHREREVLALVGQEKTTNQIADELKISRRTVEIHKAHIRMKLGIVTNPLKEYVKKKSEAMNNATTESK